MLDNLEPRDLVLLLAVSIVIVLGSMVIVDMLYTPEETNIILTDISEFRNDAAVQEVYSQAQVTDLKKQVAELKSTLSSQKDTSCLKGNTVVFTIMDSDNEPIDSAKINIQIDESPYLTYFTDYKGKLKLLLEDDCYKIKISKSGYNTKEITTCIKDDNSIELHLSDD